MKSLLTLLFALLLSYSIAQNFKSVEIKTIPVDNLQLSKLKSYDPQICYFTSVNNSITSLKDLKTENIAISSMELLNFIASFNKDFKLVKFTPGAYTAINVSILPPDRVFNPSDTKTTFYIAFANQKDSIRNAVQLDFVAQSKEETVENNVQCSDTVLKIKDKGFVNGFTMGSGTLKKRYKPDEDFHICYLNVIIDKLDNRTLKLDLDKLKLIDENDAEFSVFGVTASNFKEITYNTRTEMSGGKSAAINISESFQPNLSYIHLYHIIGSYNAGSNTVKNYGSIAITGHNQSVYSVSAGDQNNFITFSKTPFEFGVAFIVPQSSNAYRLIIDKSAYSIAELLPQKTEEKKYQKENANNVMVSDKNDSKTYNTADFRWPHKKAIAIEMNYMVGANLIGGDVAEIVKNEDSFLKSLGLVWQETQNGQVVSTTPIDEYEYVEGVYIGGFRVSYFLSNTFSLGGNFRFYDYSQSLKIDKDEGDESLIRINFFGPSISYLVFSRNRFGISLKTDFSLVSGKFETIPALRKLNDENIFDDVAGLSSLINSRNKTTSLSGFQLNSGLSFHYFIARWFNIDAGLHLSYFSGEAKESLWSNTSKSFKSVTPGFYFGLNFLVKNNLGNQ